MRSPSSPFAWAGFLQVWRRKEKKEKRENPLWKVTIDYLSSNRIRASFLSSFFERVEVHLQRWPRRITKLVTRFFAAWFGLDSFSYVFPLKKWLEKEKGKVWMMKEKYFLKARWLRKGKWERDGRVFEERWFSMNEDWIRDERDIILLMILFQLNVNVKSRREGFGRKWFKDILRGVKNVGKFNTREYTYRIGKWRDGWRGLYVIIDDRFNSIEFWKVCRNVFFLVDVEKIDRGHRKWRVVIIVVIVFTVARDLSSVGRVPSVWTFRGLDRRNEIWIV